MKRVRHFNSVSNEKVLPLHEFMRVWNDFGRASHKKAHCKFDIWNSDLTLGKMSIFFTLILMRINAIVT